MLDATERTGEVRPNCQMCHHDWRETQRDEGQTNMLDNVMTSESSKVEWAAEVQSSETEVRPWKTFLLSAELDSTEAVSSESFPSARSRSTVAEDWELESERKIDGDAKDLAVAKELEVESESDESTVEDSEREPEHQEPSAAEVWLHRMLQGQEVEAAAVASSAPTPRSDLRNAGFLQTWSEQRFRFWRVLMLAPRSGGQIELHIDRMTGMTVAVKHVPQVRIRESPQAYNRAFPEDLENPWQEIDVAQRLSQGYPCPGICRCYGAFMTAKGDAMLVTEYVPGGDLFEIANQLGDPGPMREQQVWPIVCSLLEAVLALHARGVAHGDVSLENTLMRPGTSQVALVDFGMAVTSELDATRGIRGKPSYQAPEMWTHATYDARAADIFACGVAAYALAVNSYPWSSTRPGACLAFDYMQRHGLQALLQRRRVPATGVDKPRPHVIACMSPRYCRLVTALLDLDPSRRMRWAASRAFADEAPDLTQPLSQDLWGG